MERMGACANMGELSARHPHHPRMAEPQKQQNQSPEHPSALHKEHIVALSLSGKGRSLGAGDFRPRPRWPLSSSATEVSP